MSSVSNLENPGPILCPPLPDVTLAISWKGKDLVGMLGSQTQSGTPISIRFPCSYLSYWNECILQYEKTNYFDVFCKGTFFKKWLLLR